VAEKHRQASAKFKGIAVSRFARDTYFGIREARLLGLIDPETCERVALDYVGGVAKDRDAALFGIALLELLAGQGRKAAEAGLLGIASAPEHPLGTEAAQALYRVDHTGRFQSLYSMRAAAGDPDIIHLLATWPDPQAGPLLKHLMDLHPGNMTPDSSIRLAAEDALDRQQVIDDPDYDRRIGRVLSGEDEQHFYWIPWALKMAEVRPPTGLLDVCRKRLDRAESQALRDEQALLEVQGQTPGAAQRQFLTAPYASYTHDLHFDDFLLLYAKAGGKLMDFEQGRLENFTDKGDPKECLRKLLGDQ
jgi:hypothetical protein